MHTPVINFLPPRETRARVGLLGGSFNPAHSGHRFITMEALATLHLDEVWWLVSPGNPLKSKSGMKTLPVRLAGARLMARDLDGVRVTDIEARMGTVYTVDTLQRLCALYPKARFVWLMGVDNLLQLPRWQNWKMLFSRLPIAVFDRKSYGERVLECEAAQRYENARITPACGRFLADMPPPAWTFLHNRRHPASATRLRSLKSNTKGDLP